MTVYKAFRNLIIALAIVGIIVAGSLIGFSAYRIYDYAQNSQYVVSKLGSTGDEVNKIQKKLSSLGFYNGSVDGVYGNDTKSAVKAFQKLRYYGRRNMRQNHTSLSRAFGRRFIK